MNDTYSFLLFAGIMGSFTAFLKDSNLHYYFKRMLLWRPYSLVELVSQEGSFVLIQGCFALSVVFSALEVLLFFY